MLFTNSVSSSIDALVAKGRCLSKSKGDERLKLTAKIRGDAAP
jgi:hypothetical protein